MNYLKFYRLYKGYSMKDIAERSGISTSKYQQIENGEQTATSEVATKIAHVLEVSPTRIFFASKYTIREMEDDVLNA